MDGVCEPFGNWKTHLSLGRTTDSWMATEESGIKIKYRSTGPYLLQCPPLNSTSHYSTFPLIGRNKKVPN